MPLMIKRVGTEHRPIVVCDLCNSEIADAAAGNFEWSIGLQDGDLASPVFLHKECSRMYRHTRGRLDYWDDLTLLPLYLRNNLEVDEEREVRLAKVAEAFR